MSDKPIPHDWRAVGHDVTRHYNISPEDAPHVEKIVDVFFYDRNEYTYLCELTPSYYLRYLYSFVSCKDDTSDDVRDRIDDRYGYVHEPTDSVYVHVADVDPLPSVAYGQEATEEEVREYWQSNCPF